MRGPVAAPTAADLAAADLERAEQAAWVELARGDQLSAAEPAVPAQAVPAQAVRA